MVQKIKLSSENTYVFGQFPKLKTYFEPVQNYLNWSKAIWMGQKWIFNTLFLLIQTVDWFKIFLTWVKNNLDQSKKKKFEPVQNRFEPIKGQAITF